MPELNITSLNDLPKLEGWKIGRAAWDGNLPGLRITMAHAAAEKPVVLVIFSSVNFQIIGNTVIANPALSLRTEDVPG